MSTGRLAYTVEEAAELCRVSQYTIRGLIKSGEIHAVKMGDLRIGHAELERYFLGRPREASSATDEQEAHSNQSEAHSDYAEAYSKNTATAGSKYRRRTAPHTETEGIPVLRQMGPR